MLPCVQALAGLELTLELGVKRLREYSLAQKTMLCDLLPQASGVGADYGAFVTVQHPDAVHLAQEIEARGIKVDARGEYLRLCPDILTSEYDLERAAATVRALLAAKKSR